MVQFKKQISFFFFFSSNSVLCVIQTKCIKYLVSCHLWCQTQWRILSTCENNIRTFFPLESFDIFIFWHIEVNFHNLKSICILCKKKKGKIIFERIPKKSFKGQKFSVCLFSFFYTLINFLPKHNLLILSLFFLMWWMKKRRRRSWTCSWSAVKLVRALLEGLGWLISCSVGTAPSMLTLFPAAKYINMLKWDMIPFPVASLMIHKFQTDISKTERANYSRSFWWGETSASPFSTARLRLSNMQS